MIQLRRIWWAWLLGAVLVTGCGSTNRYDPLPPTPVITDPTDPVKPPKPPVVVPTPGGAIDEALFKPFKRGQTTLDEVKAAVGPGYGQANGTPDNLGNLWFYYIVTTPGYPDGTLGFRKNAQGIWVLESKLIGL